MDKHPPLSETENETNRTNETKIETPEQDVMSCESEVSAAESEKNAPDPSNESEQLSREELYHRAKEREMEKLYQEIEDKKSRDTKKKQRNWWIKTVLMLLLIVFSVVIMFTINQYLSDDGAMSFSQMIKNASPTWFAIFIAVTLFYMVVESSKYAYLLKVSTGKFRLRVSIKTMYLGKYYDGITPLATGGQPFQIYYLHKKKIPAGVATSVPLVRFIVTTMVSCIIAVGLLILTPYVLTESNSVTTITQIIAWITIAVNFMFPLLLIFVSLFPRMGKKLIAWIVSVLSKVHIVRRKYPTMKKYISETSEYCNALKVLIRHWWRLIPLVLICILEIALYFALPFFATLAIAGPNVSEDLGLLFIQMMCLTMISYYSVSWVPTPGNGGASEIASTLVFCTLANVSGIISWMVLLWRFSTFYVYILSGIGINIFEIIRSAVRRRRAQKQK